MHMSTLEKSNLLRKGINIAVMQASLPTYAPPLQTSDGTKTNDTMLIAQREQRDLMHQKLIKVCNLSLQRYSHTPSSFANQQIKHLFYYVIHFYYRKPAIDTRMNISLLLANSTACLYYNIN